MTASDCQTCGSAMQVARVVDADELERLVLGERDVQERRKQRRHHRQQRERRESDQPRADEEELARLAARQGVIQTPPALGDRPGPGGD